VLDIRYQILDIRVWLELEEGFWDNQNRVKGYCFEPRKEGCKDEQDQVENIILL